MERARCEAAAACGYPDVEECQRYHRDQCLHGVNPESVSSLQVDACVQDIQRAGRCAAGQGPSTPANTCSERVAADTPARTACDVVLSPELAQSCAFLVPDAPPVTPAADGGA